MSKIEWTNETWNPITGCTKCSDGCKNCYAEKMHTRLRGMGSAKYQHDFNKIVCHPEELSRNFGKKSKMIFVNSMSDIFHDEVPREFIYDVFWAAARQPQHIFQFLTKRPYKNTPASFGTLPHSPNIWFGITVENKAAKKRLEVLKESPRFPVQFLSCEPLLEDLGELDLSKIDWVIVGGESGKNARPCHPDWVSNIQKQCEAQGVPFFFKQWGEYQNGSDGFYKPEINIVMLNNGDYLKNSEYSQDGIYKYLRAKGKPGDTGYWKDIAPTIMAKVGKKKAGCLLNGKEYKEYPKIV